MRLQRIGCYDVTALLGEGGMGQVWQATDTQLNRQVALKILPDAFAADPDRLARFAREAQILASLNHVGRWTTRRERYCGKSTSGRRSPGFRSRTPSMVANTWRSAPAPRERLRTSWA